jgi:HAD superfamily hydrolase (TIGR01509 family)
MKPADRAISVSQSSQQHLVNARIGSGGYSGAAMNSNARSRSIELLIFDCDGVIVDSERLAVRIDARILGELGWEISEAEVAERFLGRSDADVFAEVEARLGLHLSQSWRDEYARTYRAVFEAELRPVEGIVAALDEIERMGLAICVASSGTHEKICHSLGVTGLLDRFEGRIFSAADVARGKPAPDLFLYAANRLGVAPEACAVVEDSRSGVQAARAAGMLAFGFAGGLTAAAHLAGTSTVVFESMHMLPHLIRRQEAASPGR